MTFKRQTGGSGQFARVILKVEPGETGSGFEFVDAIRGGSIPKEFIPPVEKGVIEALSSGVKAGYPVVDVKVTLVDGSFHEVDSSEMAFKVAGSMAMKEGLERGRSIILEPLMEVEAVVPEEYVGDVIGNLSASRGLIEGMEMRLEGIQSVRAMVPLAEMFGYATRLRSMTQGRGTFTMEFDHYAPVSENIAADIVRGIA